MFSPQPENPRRSPAALVAGALLATLTLAGAAVAEETFETEDPAEMAELAADLDDRTELAGHAVEVFQQQRDAGELDHAAWLGAIEYLGGWMPEADREMVQDELAAALAGDGESIAAMDGPTAIGTGASLVSLGDRPEAGRVLSEWVTGSEAYTDLAVAELRRVAWLTRQAGDEGHEAQRELVDHLLAEPLADGEAARAAGLDHLHKLTEFLHPSMDADRRQAWAGRLEQAFADAIDRLEGRSHSEVDRLAQALSWAGAGQRERLMGMWLAANPRWREAEGLNKYQLQSTLENVDNDDLDAMLEHLIEQQIPEGELSGEQWSDLTWMIRRALDEEQRQSWHTAMEDGLAGTAEAAGAWSLPQLRQLSLALDQVGPARAEALAVRWSQGGAQWDEAGPSDLAWLSNALAEAGEAGEAGLEQLAGHLEEVYLPDAAAVQEAGPRRWSEWAREPVRKHLDDEQREIWVAALRNALVEDPQYLAELDPRDAIRTASALHRLGDEEAREAVVRYVELSDHWQHLEDRGVLVQVARQVSKADDPAEDARRRIASYLIEHYLTDNETIRATPAWGVLSRMGRYEDEDMRRWWASRLRAAIAPETEDVAELSFEQMQRLRGGMRPVDVAASDELTLLWLEHHEAVEQVPAAALARLVRMTLAGPVLDDEQREQMASAYEQLIAAMADEEMDFEQHIAMLRMWRAIGHEEREIEWAERSAEALTATAEARQRAELEQLELAADYLVAYGRYGEDHPHDDLALALVHQAETGALDEPNWPDILGEAIAAPGSRQLLQDQALLDGDGRLRLGVAAVLSWAARAGGDLDAWQGFLGEQADEAADADVRARWLLARGYAEGAQRRSFARTATVPFYEQALAAGASDPVRYEAVERLAEAHMHARRFEEAEQLVESVAGQFTQPEVVEQIESLGERVEREAERVAAERAERRAEARQQRREAWRAEIERRLKRARERGDSEGIRRYERLLEQ